MFLGLLASACVVSIVDQLGFLGTMVTRFEIWEDPWEFRGGFLGVSWEFRAGTDHRM